MSITKKPRLSDAQLTTILRALNVLDADSEEGLTSAGVTQRQLESAIKAVQTQISYRTARRHLRVPEPTPDNGVTPTELP